MTPSEARTEIARFGAELLRAGVAIEFNGAILRQLPHHTFVTWPSNVSGLMTDGSFGSIAEYRYILQNREYTVLLNDGGAIQMSCLFAGTDVIKQRLAYFPCPLVLEDGTSGFNLAQLDEYILNDLEMHKLLLGEDAMDDSETLLRLRSPLRFEFDAAAQAEGHPASHLHMINNRTRCPVFAPLSIGHFVRFIMRHFYPNAWDQSETLRTWPLRMFDRTVTADEERELYIECRHA